MTSNLGGSNTQLLLSRLLEERQQQLAPGMPDAEFFELLTAAELLKHFDLGVDELQDGLIGGGSDGGIDGFYVLVGGDPLTPEHITTPARELTVEVVIFQAKASQSFSGTALDKLISTFATAFDLGRDIAELRKLYNERLIEHVRLFRVFFQANFARISQLEIHTYYVTRGEHVHPALHAQVESLKAVSERLFPGSTSEFAFVGATDLLLRLRTPRPEWLELALAESPLVAGNSGYVGLVRLADFARFLTEDDGQRRRRLFLENVRDFEGDTAVNQAIAETLVDPNSGDFWTLNNGVTILAGEVRQGYRSLGLREPKIVNGLQTSTVIFDHSRRQSLEHDQRSLLVRVVVPTDGAAQDRIIVATNSQTPIARGVLKAADAVHKDIEVFFSGAGLFYERRRNSHRNDGVPLDKIVTIPQLARAVTAVLLQQPHLAAKVSSQSRLLVQDKHYSRIFAQDYPLRAYLTCAALVKRVETFLGRPGLDEEFDQHYGQKRRPALWWTQWHVAMALGVELAPQRSVTPESLAALEVETLADEDVERVIRLVTGFFGQAKGDHKRTIYQLSKSQALTNALLQRLGRSQRRAPTHP